MGKTFSGDKLYFDELAEGISNGITFDSNYNWDADFGTGIHAIGTIELVETYRSVETLIISMLMTFDTKEVYGNSIDILPLVPEKFRSSPVLTQFIEVVNRNVGEWLGSIYNTRYLLDPYTVAEDYIDYLADLIGLTFVVNEDTTIVDKRAQLYQAVDWYKSKGTYQSLLRIGRILGITLDAYDLYTDSESNYNAGVFTRASWYAGGEGTNPSGLDSSYFKTPYMGIDINLDTVYTGDSDDYLFKSQMYTDLSVHVEKIRPVNVVVLYYLNLYPVTDETSTVTTVDGNIQTLGLAPWTYSKINFDQSDSNTPIFDDGVNYFDYTDSTFLRSFTKWKLGVGNKGVSPDNSSFGLETVVLTGTIDNITLYSDRAEYEIFVPRDTVQAGVSELGIFLSNGITMKIASTFPDIDLISGVSLRILVKLYFNRV